MNERELEQARAKWRYRGERRPEFAIPPGPGQESVWDYPRPPRLDLDRRRVRVLAQGTTLADTSSAYRVLETASPPTFYLPPEDVRTDLLVRAPGSSHCEWKGAAMYWSLQLENGQSVAEVGWSYRTPYERYVQIEDYFSFYPAKVECYVDDHRVLPQPGGFYGGWVTPDVVGPFKGEPGTGGW